MSNVTQRVVDPELRDLLINNEPHLYAHLVKFERPSRPDTVSGRVSTSAERYAYFTDGSIDIAFNDGSTDLLGNPNGSQIYLANKVISVGDIEEDVKATTSSTNIVVNGNSLGARITGVASIDSLGNNLYDVTWNAPIYVEDLVGAGFREGDKVLLDGVAANIVSFRGENVVRLSRIDNDLVETTNESLTMSLASEEILSILLNKNDIDYASFINREVFIYRAYFDEDRQLVGTPFLIFKGIINNVNFDDSETSIKVTWGLSSHWGDFAQVKGRVTSDGFHRALDANGVPQPESALRPEYAYDKGFIHSETSVNVLANYTVTVEKQDVKYKKGFLGVGSKVKVNTYNAQENRSTKLDFNIRAKSLPVVYGVRKVEGINIFADTLNNDSSTVYVAQALCEGEISSIYDVYINDNSLICNDKQDFDSRSSQASDNSVEVVCRGRADRGDVLGGSNSIGSQSYSFYQQSGERRSITDPFIYNYISDWRALNYNEPVTTTSSSFGIIDGQSINLTSPQNFVLDFFSGRPGQKASTNLSNIAFNNNFKIQNSYWEGTDTAEYWGPNHRLLDTAYVVGKTIIEEGDTTLPDISYIVRGKVIPCFNYDYSYSHDQKESSENADFFKLGDFVTLVNPTGGATLNTNVQIIDKWTIVNPDGSSQVRFRFDKEPALAYDSNGIPSITRFRMVIGPNTWTMLTWNFNILEGTIPSSISSPITSTLNNSGDLEFRFNNNTDMGVVNSAVNNTPKFQVVDTTLSPHIRSRFFARAVIGGNSVSNNSLVSSYPSSTYGGEASTLPSGSTLASKSTIKLSSSASSVNNFYTGYLLKVTRVNPSTGRKLTQTSLIEGYDGASKIATINDIFDFIPNSGDTFTIYPRWVDSRATINPAIITLDYVSSDTYGKGLSISEEIFLPSWQNTARSCDARSNVTTLMSSDISSVQSGDVYRYMSGSTLIWQGKVLTTEDSYCTFTDNIGKLSNKWNSWKSFTAGEILYNSQGRFYLVSSTGVKGTEPTHTSGTVNGMTYVSSISISKVSGSGPTSLSFDLTQGNFVQGINSEGQKISGYSLYDSDDLVYWKYCGWDVHAQRSVTRNQCNILLDTAEKLSDNTNALLDHFNGIFRYSGGRYYLDIESQAGEIGLSDIRTITEDEIVGSIKLSDEGNRGRFNSLTVAFSDPANKFEPRNIGFFNSDFLKIDRNVPKKGNLTLGGITNYYNTRLLADTYLKESRYGLSITFVVRPIGMLLLSGLVIQIIYDRYGWNSPGKLFRISKLRLRPDGLIEVVAKEHDDSFFALTNIRGEGSHSPSAPVGVPSNTGIGNPTGLIVTSADTADELLNGVELLWKNSPAANTSSVSTEIFAGISPNLFTKVTSISGNILTTTGAHNLVVGQPIYPTTTIDGIVSGTTYFVQSTPTTSSFSISETKGGSVKVLVNAAGLDLDFRTATLIATVPAPINSFLDTVVNPGTNRVEKYYWIRHKVTR